MERALQALSSTFFSPRTRFLLTRFLFKIRIRLTEERYESFHSPSPVCKMLLILASLEMPLENK